MSCQLDSLGLISKILTHREQFNAQWDKLLPASYTQSKQCTSTLQGKTSKHFNSSQILQAGAFKVFSLVIHVISCFPEGRVEDKVFSDQSLKRRDVIQTEDDGSEVL